MKPKIIVIDSDRRAQRLITGILDKDYEVFPTLSISEGYSAIASISPDIIILDPLYPKKEGTALIKSVREWSDCSIIAVSENSSERAAVSIIDAGADDYIRKPFFSAELKARVEACVRRIKTLEAAKGIHSGNYYLSGELKLEYDTRRVTLCSEDIHLTKNEFKILSLLCRYSGKVLTYDYILKSVWGPKADSGTGILRVNVANLRRKLEADPLSPKYLFTENGVGYRVAENEAL